MVRWSAVAPWLVAAVMGVVGVAVWNGVYDLYVSRGAREYLAAGRRSRAGPRPAPSDGRRHGLELPCRTLGRLELLPVDCGR